MKLWIYLVFFSLCLVILAGVQFTQYQECSKMYSGDFCFRHLILKE